MTAGAIVAEVFYSLIGIIFILMGAKSLRDKNARKKTTTVAFWFIMAFIFIFGFWLPKWITGVCILAFSVLTAVNGVQQSKNEVSEPGEIRARANATGYKVFIPALCLAVIAVITARLGAAVPALSWITSDNAIGLSGICGIVVAVLLFKTAPKHAVTEGTRLMDNIGPIGILPQLLSALGALFTAAGVGDVIANGVSSFIPDGSRFIACIVYCVAIAVFTIIMGNGYASFSVITVGIGIPFLIMQGANPLVVGALGITASYCGTLVTPMGANFNIMPAALLEMRNKYGIIKSQAATALVMLIVHIVLLYVLAF